MMHAAVLDTAAIVAALRLIVPPTALIDVGIGRGTGAMHQWRGWDVATVWLVDAEPAQLDWAELLRDVYPEWHVRSAILAEADGYAQYYRASNPAESGLVPTSNLTALWPNLHEAERSVCQTTRLDTLLYGETSVLNSQQLWLIVDCLPTLSVLQGATRTLEQCSVLWLRALLRPLPESVAGTTLEELEAFLAPLGFRCVQASEGNHPALGDALFVRDWARWLQPVIAELQANSEQCQNQTQLMESRLAAHKAAEKAMLQESETQATFAATRQTQLNMLEAEKAERVDKLSAVEKARTELASKLAVVEKEYIAKAEALAAMQSKATADTRERNALTKMVTEHQAKIEALVKEKADLTSTLDGECRLAAERQAKLDTVVKKKDELTGRLSELIKTNTELNDKLSVAIQQEGLAADAQKTAQVALTECTSESSAQAKLATERQAKIDALVKEKADLAAKLDGQTKLAGERQIQFDTIAKEKAVLTEKLVAADKAKQEYSKYNDTFEERIEELTKARDEQSEMANEYANQVSQLTSQRDNLNIEYQALKSDLQDKDAAIAILGEQVTELDQRERRLVEEIVRAEAQIELIKDLLLREGGL